ncbi:MAG TPA: SRPBCC family protein [Glycomyces sp.]|nr:SRPBCC family protein [Glycomyces sp.]
MTTYTHTADTDIAADTLFGFLADPRNLPRYFPEMTVAEPQGGESVHVEANVHGEHVEGQAWVRPNTDERRLEWGSEGPDDYHGELRVDELAPGRSQITVSLHSVREAEGDEVQSGLERTVATLTQAAVADDQAWTRGEDRQSPPSD